MIQPVNTKADFVRRYRAGEFGNASPTWDTLREFQRSGYMGLIHLRNRVAGGLTFYDVPSNRVVAAYHQALSQGVRPENLYFSAMAPTDKTLFQGEVQQSVHYLDLFYSTIAKPMRSALAERSHAVSGIIAVQLLRYFLCVRSFEWLEYLFKTYPDHTIEFSTYSVNWGTMSGYNTVFWEVRNY